MRATLALNGLNKYDHFQNFKIIISTPSLSSPTFSSNGTNKKSIRKHELVKKKNRCLRHEPCMKPVFFFSFKSQAQYLQVRYVFGVSLQSI